jgi:hypothetical protein
MEYKVESSLYNFPAWQGGKDTLDTLIEKGDCEKVEDFLETIFLEHDVTDEDINDFLWFERDQIAEYLGYADWDEYEYGEDEEETYEDINGVKLDVGDEVLWHDEAGLNEDGSMITFTILEERGDGYFNLSYGDEDENPERWAYYTELEIV